MLKPAAKEAGVSVGVAAHPSPFNGRRLFREGWNVKAVQTFLGHSSATFTRAVYVRHLEGDMPGLDFFELDRPLVSKRLPQLLSLSAPRRTGTTGRPYPTVR